MKKNYVLKIFYKNKVVKEKRCEDTEEEIKKIVDTIKGITGEEYQIKYFEE